MFPSPEAETEPFAIWLNGGPGASSAYANFLFNGPMEIKNHDEDEYKVKLNPQGSWKEEATMLYVD